MATFSYPTQSELTLVAQNLLPRLTKDRPIFDIFPTRDVDAHYITWEQQDNYIGLQQIRGLNGDPAKVKRVGAKRYTAEPMVFGEFLRVDEEELTIRRSYGTWNQPISIDDLVIAGQEQLMLRQLDQIENICWQLLTTGSFSVVGPDKAIIASDSYTTQTFTAGTTWATTATATPLQNFRSIQLLSRGYSVNFGTQATAYMNRTTFNYLVANTNSADLYGKRTAGLATVLGIKDINLVLANEDLPQIQIYDAGYYDDTNTFQLFIPSNKVVVIGQRPAGQKVGEYRMTRNANNPNLAPGMYQKVIDQGEDAVPRMIDVHAGHNGHPLLFYPSAIVLMNV
ncbi:MAG: major capsid protein [Chloroflexi bacterium]|uniref:Major capsid protein n=1 Tax=Candidatus Chlorohelix allophototropha TaxID=3003348 RepID=A0A8T7M2T3_9CHLR|nr:major capsid protein [Chloroflexota bacterium]WJW65829.1 major capsid protein [Chloroflexota bacterium L227-S17]